MRNAMLLVVTFSALTLVGVSSSSCSGSNGGGAGGGSGGSTGGGSGGSTGGGSAGGTAGGAAMPDADAGICDAGVFNCTVFEDRTAPDAGRTLEFGTTDPNGSVPECMKVKAGQTVKFVTGAFHPVGQLCGPKNGKLTAPDMATTNITLDVPGNYGYQCTVHLFRGGIQVVP